MGIFLTLIWLFASLLVIALLIATTVVLWRESVGQ